MFILIELPTDRTRPGQLVILDQRGGDPIWGPRPCLGKADNKTAAQQGNPQRLGSRSFGDTPTGEFQWLTIAAGKPETTYGASERVLMIGKSGDFLAREEAAKARGFSTAQILIHAGAPNAKGGLRPTFGCVRLSAGDQAELIAFLKSKGETKGEGLIKEI